MNRLQGEARNLWLNSLLYKRLKQLPVSFSQIEDTEAPDVLRACLENNFRPSIAGKVVVFRGRTLSELANFLKQVRAGSTVEVASPKLLADTTLRIPSRIHLKGKNAAIEASNLSEKPVFLLENAHEAAVSGFIFLRASLGIVVRNSRRIYLGHLTFREGGTAIACVESGGELTIEDVRLRSLKGPGILLQGNFDRVWLRRLDIRDTKRADNGGAGLVITDASADLNAPITTETIRRLTTEALHQTIYPYSSGPRRVLIEESVFAGNRAQGIYCEGCVGVVIRRNLILGNDKEGICLDWGSARNLVLENVVEGNGFRRRQTDEDLRRDLVLRFGRLADGSAVAKLPGISLDNAAENIIARNVVRENAGDGIKLVRSSFRNLILFNVILHNARGNNHRFVYTGVLIGSAGAEPEILKLIKTGQFKAPLDYLPSMENIVAANVIDGEHYWGILLDRDTAYNDIYDNTVHHQLKEPLASATQKFNSIMGNSWQRRKPESTLLDRLKNLF
ncbi:right-handed parallel beta-helix repeat-containing protein [Thermosulfurimonas sp. F29]|uniref:right-handed parallel beta-helix repeat-containing protein n=1 Tax=Thermosulfurimonas sp. F29 TaxID=2867247 RepID=UPI001C83E9A6|nr:right-handed parallel beta-helix repeat-containing protein [Thermosulfurimonas sp. F29]MBX6424293.1 right-handed parallel beta-helix repeat-containing protein [Thermosulfurimonas sp. F29]